MRGNYDVAGRKAEAVTFGWQTFNWGESLYIRNGLNAVNPDQCGRHPRGGRRYPQPLLSGAGHQRCAHRCRMDFSLEAFDEFICGQKAQLDPVRHISSAPTLP